MNSTCCFNYIHGVPTLPGLGLEGLGCFTILPVAQPFLPKPHLPMLNRTDNVTAKIQVNPIKVRELMEFPVLHITNKGYM